MSNLFLIGSDLSICGGMLEIVRVIYQIIKILMIVIPIILIVLGTIDLGKAVMASDEKEIKSAQGMLIKRLVYAAVIFFVPTIVGVVMNIVAAGSTEDTTGWANCWEQAKK